MRFESSYTRKEHSPYIYLQVHSMSDARPYLYLCKAAPQDVMLETPAHLAARFQNVNFLVLIFFSDEIPGQKCDYLELGNPGGTCSAYPSYI
jgi:hypothetical protein